MTERDAPRSTSLLDLERLPEVVSNYQQAYHAWEQTTDPLEKAHIHQQLHAIQEQLWSLINDPLLQLAKGWRRSPTGQELAPNYDVPIYTEDVLHSLAISYYLFVVEALPQLKVNPNLNLAACLVQIARHRLHDGDRKFYRREKGRDHSFNPSETEVGASWLEELRHGGASQYNQIEQFMDPHGQDGEEALLEKMYGKAMFAEIQQFWQEKLTPQEHTIMKRWETNPPTPFATLAQQLGPPWNETSVRQRHHRLMERTRKHLQQLGLHESGP